ncbi:hypothetical protein ACQP2P_44815 [Dactylosporangium sp. CA-139114]|uniref:hypothetical protein n=1 Tax=Dactylosporangium sp. CA-139114 TaxID=3239931 RepID=UPI003D977E36
MFAQDLNGVPVQGDDPAAGGALRRSDEERPTGAGDLLDDRGGAVLEVDVAPAQPDRFAAPQAPRGDEPPQGVKPVGGDQECDSPDSHPFDVNAALEGAAAVAWSATEPDHNVETGSPRPLRVS